MTTTDRQTHARASALEANCATFVNGLAAHASSGDDVDADHDSDDDNNNKNDAANTIDNKNDEDDGESSNARVFGDVSACAVASARIAVRGAALVLPTSSPEGVVAFC